MMVIQYMVEHIHQLLLFIEQAHESFRWQCIRCYDSKYDGVHGTIYVISSCQVQTLTHSLEKQRLLFKKSDMVTTTETSSKCSEVPGQ